MAVSPPQPPFGADEKPAPSPEQEQAQGISIDKGVKDRLASMRAVGPSVRQQTQAEVLNVTLLLNQLGNPFSVRQIPFSVLRDMALDPMIAFALYYIKTPLVRADWYIRSPSAKLASAVDEALRPILSDTLMKWCGALSYGYQPTVKRFKLGKLKSTYRDPHGEDPEADLPVWDSENVDALLWKEPIACSPEHCIPRWKDDGSFDGFSFFQIPLPNPVLAGMSNIYGGDDMPGDFIPAEFATWVVNERESEFGSIYGSPRTKRAYRYYWSYWFRWAMADRAYENRADPPKKVFFPPDPEQGIDSNDPDPDNPTSKSLRQVALELGENARSGATLAIPSTFVRDEMGKQTAQREWDIEYLTGGDEFPALDETFAALDALKMRSLFIPEQAFLEAKHGASSRLVVGQLGEVYQESQQTIADYHDQLFNLYWIPQFVAANFPELVGIPCEKVSRGFGAQDQELVQQLLQTLGQAKEERLPVDTRELLRQQKIPLLSEAQMQREEKKVIERAREMHPSPIPPEKQGTQGYNAGVMKTEQGETRYFEPPGMISLAEHGSFMESLPDTPHFRDVSSRSAALRLRKLFQRRYDEVVSEFAKHVSDRNMLRLAQEEQEDPQQQHGMSVAQATTAAAALLAAFGVSVTTKKVSDHLRRVLSTVVRAAGTQALALAHLDTSVFDVPGTGRWVDSRVQRTLESVDQTVRRELETFMRSELQRTVDSKELAAALEEHFADLPQTHADLVAQEEVVAAHNFATLQAGKDAGVSQVQAHDASDGMDRSTDRGCIERNGRVFTIAAAANERRHPRCTLYWTYLLSEEFSVERVESLPERLEVSETALAVYDERNETLYVKDSATSDQETAYLLALGERLRLG